MLLIKSALIALFLNNLFQKRVYIKIINKKPPYQII